MNNDAAATRTTNWGYAILRRRLPLTWQGVHNNPVTTAEARA